MIPWAATSRGEMDQLNNKETAASFGRGPQQVSPAAQERVGQRAIRRRESEVVQSRRNAQDERARLDQELRVGEPVTRWLVTTVTLFSRREGVLGSALDRSLPCHSDNCDVSTFLSFSSQKT